MTTVVKREPAYFFDTSAFVALNRTDANVIRIPRGIWQHLQLMMRAGQIVSHKLVFDELASDSKTPDFIARWIVGKEKYFLKKTPRQIQLVATIVANFPGLIDVNSEHEQADPWLIALAVEKSKTQTLFAIKISVVVSQENSKSSQRIPAACKHFGIDHRSLREFFEEVGLSVSLVRR